MAQVIVTFSSAVTKAQDGAAQVVSAYPRASEELATSGTHAVTDIAAGSGDIARVENLGDNAVWVKFGAAPVAAVEDGWIIPATSVREFGGLVEGHKASVVDDS